MTSAAGLLATEPPLKVAVVGAGLSGLTCARVVSDHGHRVRVFDKARGPGGRMSTRRACEHHFDHGAQYFTVRDPRFARWVDGWRRDGLVAVWTGEIAVVEGGATLIKDVDTERWVAVPGMNSICRHLAAGLEMSYETRVSGMHRMDGRWHLEAEGGPEIGEFDALVVSAPAPQTAALLESAAPELAARAAEVEMAPCWAAMVTFPRRLDTAFDGAFLHRSALSWAARNASKPGRPDGESWILHGSPDWSREHMELERDQAAACLLEAFGDAVGGLPVDPAHLDAHRWRFALPVEALPEACLFDLELSLAACGDWCGGPRVEGAFLSGLAAADQILSLRPAPR